MQEVLKNKVAEALIALGVQGVEPVIEYPGDLAHGDFATNVAMVAFAKWRDDFKKISLVYSRTSSEDAKKELPLNAKLHDKFKNVIDLAEKLKVQLGDIEHVDNIEIAGPGFINFHLSRDYFSNTLEAVDESWGKNDNLKGKTVVVEYTSPNLFKPLHIGNLMANIVGETVSRFVEWSGADIKRVNYPSDIGLTVAKGVWGVLHKHFDPSDVNELGKAYVEGNTAYEEDEQAKQEINAINKKLYEGDPELTAIRKQGIETSLARIRELCAILGTAFDAEFFESQVGEKGRDIVRENVPKVFEESDGALIFPGEQYGLHTRVFVNSMGLPTYEAKELALTKEKYDTFHFDRSIVITGAEQKEYFKVVYKAAELVFPELAGKLVHIGNGFLTLTTGKMSSRKGNVLSGEAVLDGVRAEALEVMAERDLGSEKETIANQVAVAAIKYAVLKQATGKNIVFDQKTSLSFDGDSGPYLQYSYVRAQSILEKAGNNDSINRTSVPEGVAEFERLLPRFPQVVQRAGEEYEPHYVTTYLTELASAFNSWYAQERIIGSKHESYKLALVSAFAQTMKNGLSLLGIVAPTKM